MYSSVIISRDHVHQLSTNKITNMFLLHFRLLLFFIPRKYQPDYVFLKYVPLHRVHLFTFFQFTALVGLWMIKSNPTTSIAFPVRPVWGNKEIWSYRLIKL